MTTDDDLPVDDDIDPADFDALAGLAPPRTPSPVDEPPDEPDDPSEPYRRRSWDTATIDEKFRDIDALERGFKQGTREREMAERRAERERVEREGPEYKPLIGESDYLDAFLITSVADDVLDGQAERAAFGQNRLAFGMTFLDDCLRALMPTDLVLLGAGTGIGKTQLSMHIGATNSLDGKRVLMFALEAERKEIAKRMQFRLASDLLFAATHERMFFADWRIDDVSPAARRYSDIAEGIIAERHQNFRTYYRQRNFSVEDLARLLVAERSHTDLFVIDHAHMVDHDDDNENRGQKATIKAIRDTALDVGIAVICVAHLRKPPSGTKNQNLLPGIEDFHGSSELTKIATHAVILARAPRIATDLDHHSPTLVSVAKDRVSGATGLVARQCFNLRTQDYEPDYVLGRIAGNEFTPVAPAEIPQWAAHALR